jgi:hypothetical protein
VRRTNRFTYFESQGTSKSIIIVIFTKVDHPGRTNWNIKNKNCHLESTKRAKYSSKQLVNVKFIQIFTQLAHEIQEGIEEWGGVPANVLKLQKSCPGPALSKKLRTLCWPKLLLLFGIADHEQRDGGKMMDDNYKRICISELPLHGMIGTKPNGQRVMELRAAFLGNGTHFTAVIKSGTTWIYYDGLDKEKKMPTNKKSAQHAMHGYSINAVLYEVVLDHGNTQKQDSRSNEVQQQPTKKEESNSGDWTEDLVAEFDFDAVN